MDRLVRELVLLTQPIASLSITEARRALGLATTLGSKGAQRRGPRRLQLAHYRNLVVDPAQEAGLLTGTLIDYWGSASAAFDPRVVAFASAYALAKATR